MDLFDNFDLEYFVDDYQEVTDFGDESFGEDDDLSEADSDSVDSDFEDDFESSKPSTDTSAIEARNGKDIQGIPWERMNFTRDKYRETRLKQYKNFESLSRSREELDKECLEVKKGKTFYDFQFNTRLVKSTIVHFQVQYCEVLIDASVKTMFLGELLKKPNQFRLEVISEQLGALRIVFYYMLRNLLWATSKHDVYLMQNYSLMHWSSLLRRGKEILNVAKPIVPTLQPGSLSQSLSRIQISTMAVKDDLIAAGGFQGELICKCLKQPGVVFCTKVTSDENAITNAVDIYHTPSGSLRVMTANNDCKIRIFDAANFASLSNFTFDWSVNNASASPDGKLLAVLGDSSECLIADAQSGKVTSNLKGHLDYSFASAWHPNGVVLATGNQDTTCRLWDIRNVSESFAVVKGNMGAIRAVRLTAEGRLLAMASPADFVHVLDTESGYRQCQEIDMFGEIAGISFSPDTEALFVGVADRTYGSLLEFNRRRHNHYLDSI